MSKITFENKKGKATITNRLSYPETINERVYNAIASGMFESFLPVSIYQKRKETRIECMVQELIPLTQYFQGVVTKMMFLDIVREIVLQIKICEKNMLNANNLDLQSDRIFIDPKTKSIKSIFWPVVNNQRANPPHLYLKQLPLELNFSPLEDTAYLETYKAFFNWGDPFSLNNFDRLLLTLVGEKGSDEHSSRSDTTKGQTETMREVDIEYDPFAHNDKRSDRERKHDVGQIICPHCGVPNQAAFNYCAHCGAQLAIQNTEQEKMGRDHAVDQGMLVFKENSSETTVLGYDSFAKTVFPILVRSRTAENFFINRPIFRIGTDLKYCDLVINDNSFISHSHADIIMRDGRYYIVDHNSTNKTFVNGRVIPAEVEIEICFGTQIRLANEDFIFNVGS